MKYFFEVRTFEHQVCQGYALLSWPSSSLELPDPVFIHSATSATNTTIANRVPTTNNSIITNTNTITINNINKTTTATKQQQQQEQEQEQQQQQDNNHDVAITTTWISERKLASNLNFWRLKLFSSAKIWEAIKTNVIHLEPRKCFVDEDFLLLHVCFDDNNNENDL